MAPPKQRREKQPVRLDDPAQLDQRAGQIGDPMQRQRADREIEARRAERQQLRVGDDRQRRARPQKARGRVGGDDPLDPRPSGERPRQRAAVRAQIEHRAELPTDIVEPVDDPFGDLGVQEIDAGPPRRALAVQPPGPAIEQWRRLGIL